MTKLMDSVMFALICQAIDSTNDGKVNKIRIVEWYK